VKIGIVTPARDAAATLGDTIRSVLAQSHTDWRMAIVDDGSRDATEAVAGSFCDPRLAVLSQPTRGVSAARNRGIAAIRADAFLFLDADDTLVPEALAELSATLEACPWAAAATGAWRFAPSAGPTGRTHRAPEGSLLEPLLRRNRFANGGHVLVRSEAVAEAGPFDTALRYGEDWDYWVRIALCGEFAAAGSAAPLLLVRQRPEGAYARLAADPASFDPCMAAIFGNPALAERLGHRRVAELRRAASAENAWVIGREMIRHGRSAAGFVWLRHAVRLLPSVRRLALLAAVPAVLQLPAALRGALRPYADAGRPAHQPGAALAEPG
jgi:glycosyltransferase involved in cell wall biosynthesis